VPFRIARIVSTRGTVNVYETSRSPTEEAGKWHTRIKAGTAAAAASARGYNIIIIDTS